MEIRGDQKRKPLSNPVERGSVERSPSIICTKKQGLEYPYYLISRTERSKFERCELLTPFAPRSSQRKVLLSLISSQIDGIIVFGRYVLYNMYVALMSSLEADRKAGLLCCNG